MGGGEGGHNGTIIITLLIKLFCSRKSMENDHLRGVLSREVDIVLVIRF